MSAGRRRTPETLVIVTRDTARGLALVTGSPAAERAAVLVATDARWSRRARGWVISLEDALNLRGYCQDRRLLLHERTVSDR